MIVIDPNKTFDFVLPSKAGEADPPTLILKPMTFRERLVLKQRRDAIEAAGEDQLAMTDMIWDLVEEKTVGWRNVTTVDGEPQEFRPDLLQWLEDSDVGACFTRITELSMVTPEEAGKS